MLAAGKGARFIAVHLALGLGKGPGFQIATHRSQQLLPRLSYQSPSSPSCRSGPMGPSLSPQPTHHRLGDDGLSALFQLYVTCFLPRIEWAKGGRESAGISRVGRGGGGGDEAGQRGK